MKEDENISRFLFPVQPDNWDDEEDGVWKPPKVPNPAYKGPWKRKVCQFSSRTTEKQLEA